jgi:F0F1-type ATP synthase epsilon subunit
MIEEKTDAAKKLEEAKAEHADSGKPSMHIKVYSPFKVYFDDEGESISGANATGPFDILPSHHNFMTLLTPCELIIRNFRGEQKILISGGLMHVKADQITVFLDI